MANALMLEQLLGTGQFASAAELTRRIGVQKHLLIDLCIFLFGERLAAGLAGYVVAQKRHYSLVSLWR